MKKGLLFIAPLAVASLFSCGGGNGSPVDYDTAVDLVTEYRSLVKDNKPKDLHFTGTINAFDLDGDLVVKTKRGFEDSPIDLDLKDAKFSIAKQDLVNTDIPVSLFRQYFPGSVFGGKLKLLIGTLPTIPLSEPILYFFDGFKIVRDQSGQVSFKHEEYKSINTQYYKIGNKLNIKMETEDLIESIQEIISRVSDPSPVYTNIKVPTSMSVTFSEMGFIEDFSFAFKTPERLIVKAGDPNLREVGYYVATNATLNVDVSLHIERTYYETVNLNFQAIEYKIENNKVVQVGEPTPLTSHLKDLENYFTVEWYDQNQGTTPLDYDDPIARINYWNDRERNIAFESDNYDVIIVPAHNPITDQSPIFTPKYEILGATVGKKYEDKGIKMPDNLSSISYNGYLVSESDPQKLKDLGVEVPFVKYQDSMNYIWKKDPTTGEASFVEAKGCADTYIPAKYIKDKNGTYIVSIAVLKLGE